MDSRGRALDNILIERFRRTLKYEFLYCNEFTSAGDLSKRLSEYIRYYNNERYCSSVGGNRPPSMRALRQKELPRSLGYLGDLLVTAYSLFSRNRNLGNLIGKGYTVKSAVQSMSMVAEGYYATRGIYEIAFEKKLKTPIINTVFSILYEGKDAEKQFKKLTEKLT